LLPFLKKNDRSVGLLVTRRTPDEKPASEITAPDEAGHAEAIKACAQDLIDAVHAKDVARTAEAMKSAFEILDSLSHEEGPHTSED
jgi:hypothetical protein